MRQLSSKWAIASLIIILAAAGCRTPEQLAQKAIRLDPNIFHCDTTEKIVTIEKEVASIVGYDSIMIDNDKIILKVVGQGKLILNYEVKEQKRTVPVEKPVIKPSKSKTEIKEENKTKRKETKWKGKTEISAGVQDRKVKVADSNNEHKNIKAQNKKQWWDHFWLGFIVGTGGLLTLLFLIRKFVPKLSSLIHKFI